MALRIGGVPVLFSPAEVAGGIRAVLGWTDEAVDLVAGLPGRVDRLLADAETLLGEVRRLAERVATIAEQAEAATAAAEQVVATATTVTTTAEEVVAQTTESVQRADAAIADAARAAAEASGLLATYQPIAERAAPLAKQFVEEFSAKELHAAIRMVDSLPRLTEHIESDVLPLLATLDHVGPDLRELIALVTDVRNALASVPGMRLLRGRRSAEQPT